MAITKRPRKSSETQAVPSDEHELRIEAFITGTEKREETRPESGADGKRARVMMRFDPDLLARIDTAAKRRGVSRTAWLHMVASRALDNGDG
jgi:hypothetical protein